MITRKWLKYPRIAHVPFSSKTDPDDFFTDLDIFGKEWIVTEKLDGSQIGIQFVGGAPDVRNRNADILHGGADRQFHPFPAWFSARYDAMWNLLGDDYVLFGEWLFHVHTAQYDTLPDWFVAFDMLDKHTGEFLLFDDAFRRSVSAGLAFVPVLGRDVIHDEKHLLSFIARSTFGSGDMEGVVLHSPDGKARVKYVTPAFKAIFNEHPRDWRWEPERERNSVRR